WDTPAETDLLQLYLAGGGGNEVALATQTDPFLAEANEHDWDVVLLTLTFPTIEKGFAVFETVQQLQPGVPIVLACRPTEMINLPRFLIRGLRSYVFRDVQGDFLFLVLSALESAISVAKAEEARHLAEMLRQEIEG